MANSRNTVFYVGVTNNIERRAFEHKNHLLKGFTSKYNVEKLVYFEETDDISAAIGREKQVKNWHRQWKINLIKKCNHEFNDLAEDWFGN